MLGARASEAAPCPKHNTTHNKQHNKQTTNKHAQQTTRQPDPTPPPGAATARGVLREFWLRNFGARRAPMLHLHSRRFTDPAACRYGAPSAPYNGTEYNASRPADLPLPPWYNWTGCDGRDWSGQRWLSRAPPARMAGKAKGQFSFPRDGARGGVWRLH